MKSIVRSEIRKEADIVFVRKRAREFAALLGFDLQEQTRVATAVSEIARNAFQYAGGGSCEFLIEETSLKQTLVVKIADKGPGIFQLDLILSGTYTSQTGMGVGLIGAHRLMDQVVVETSSTGTTIILKKFFSRPVDLSPKALNELMNRLVSLTREDPVGELQRQNRELMITMNELREKQEELSRLNQELEDTNRGVVALYAELDEKAESLRRASETKTRFLSNMTHEFRSPVNSILSISELLLEDAKRDHSLELEKQVMFIKKAALGVSDLVNDLLDIAKVDAGKVRMRVGRFTVYDLFSTLRGLMRPLAQTVSGGASLNFVEPARDIELTTDEGKLTQIVRNLVSNALKFTEHGSVTVTACENQEYVEFHVEDTGIGIHDQDIEAIFEEFMQVESHLQAKTRGTGLGLPLAKKLTQLLGGDLSVKSAVGKGSTFRIKVLKNYTGQDFSSYASDLTANKETQVQESLRRLKILTVDDEESMRYFTQRALEKVAEIRGAATIEEGIAQAQIFQPDLIILDWVIKNSFGSDFLARKISNMAIQSIPVVVHTSKHLEAEEEAYLQSLGIPVVQKDRDEPERFRRKILELAGQFNELKK